MTYEVNIEDTFGDVLEVSSDFVGLELKAADGEQSDWLFNREQATELRIAINHFLGDEDESGPSEPFEPFEASDDYKTDVFRFAVAHGRTVTFRYAKGDGGVIEQRQLTPHLIQEVKGNAIVVGDDPDRDGDTRAYRLDRIKGDPVIA